MIRLRTDLNNFSRGEQHSSSVQVLTQGGVCANKNDWGSREVA